MENQKIFEWNKNDNSGQLKEYLEELKTFSVITIVIPLSYAGGLCGNEIDHALIITKIK